MKIIATPIDPKMLQFGDLYSPYPQDAWDKMFIEQICCAAISIKLRGDILRLPIPLYKITIDFSQQHYPGWD